VARELVIHPEGTKERKEEVVNWSYHGKNRDKLVKLSRDSVTVEYFKHGSFSELRHDFLSVLDAVWTSFPNVQGRRLGLRYINKIELNEPRPTDWSRYLVPELLGAFTIVERADTLSRTFSVLELTEGEASFRFQYGMHNPDYPAVIRKKLFILDFDAYCNLQLNREEIPAYLDQFHVRINTLFESLITDGLRRKMEVKNAR
jgi:uncharacterized protein (TIGR04255 family)